MGSAAVAEFPLSPRELRVLQMRYGIGQVHTLEDVGKRFGVTRERIRQIEGRAIEKLAATWANPAKRLDLLEVELVASGIQVGRVLDEELVRSAVAAAQRRAPHAARRAGVDETLLVLRAAGSVASFAQRWPVSTFIACALTPAIRGHWAAYRAVNDNKVEGTRRWTYAALAERVLTEARTPMHWHSIAERAEALGLRQVFQVGTFFNSLADKAKFVRTDTGTYGLVAWGLTNAESYADIAAQILRTAGHPLTEGEIFGAVRQSRGVTQTSLGMMLDLNARFYESLEHTYGLRAWLLPRHRQTLRTPRGYVETEASFQREARARENGYDVAAIIAKDRAGT